MEDKFISFAIHSSQHALMLKRILDAHDLDVRLEKFLIGEPPLPIGVRMLVKEKDIPLALKIVESAEHFENFNLQANFTRHQGEILIPVDFNDYAFNACKAGFDLALRLNLSPVIIHACPSPIFTPNFSLDDISGVPIDNSLEEEFNDMEISRDLRLQSDLRMKELILKIREAQKNGDLPDMKFRTKLEEGVPEDVIKEYCRMNPPVLVVMITRGKDKRDEQLIGSVTAEVLDDCKVPVFSIPENCGFDNISKVKEIVFFCSMNQSDLSAVDTFMRMFEYPVVNITLIPLYEKDERKSSVKLIRLRDYFSKTYPAATFTTAIFNHKSFMADFNNYESQRGTEMIVVPNRRKNALMRLLNPGIAHRLLFERDLPLLALPI